MSDLPTRAPVGSARFFCVALLAGALGGCDQIEAYAPASLFPGRPAAAADNDAREMRDILTPELFATRETALWDGRPSLGGVWLAYPDVEEPLRVRIRNDLNGQSVVGALFRRERDNPGPRLQVSSDAAEALGILAGTPTPLAVTALRSEVGDISSAPDAALLQESAAGNLPTVAGKATTIAEPPSQEEATRRPYLQAGIFSSEENARRAVSLIAAQGVAGAVRRSGSAEAPVWRVVAGPAGTPGERDAILAKVRTAGFDDAYPVSD